jgi:hypothetical protein
MIAEAVAWSGHHGDFAIVIDKSAYTLLAYRDGLEVGRWPVELGGDPVGAKQRQGDQRTPEGRYTVTWRREQGHTRFYRALLLDYPNAADRAAGRTGSHIEIHGMGTGRRPGTGGFNWTLGCIALSNGDIDELLGLGDGDARVAEGTPVTIVYAGSLPPERYEVEQPAPREGMNPSPTSLRGKVEPGGGLGCPSGRPRRSRSSGPTSV